MRVIFSWQKCERNGWPEVTSCGAHRDQLAKRIACQLSLGVCGSPSSP